MKRVFASCAVIVALSALGADNAESGVFTYDTRYAASERTADATLEAEGFSPRFSLYLVSLAADTNNNGIPDWWETRYGLNGEAASADHDGDGFTNLEEYNMGTDPTKKDDYSLSAAESARYTLNMQYFASDMTFAATRLVFFEMLSNFSVDTLDRNLDTDGDGLPDWWERLYGLDPNKNDASGDLDGDGRANIAEYNAGTDPTKKENYLAAIKESDTAFTADTRIVYSGEKPVFGETFCVFAVSGGFVCDTDGLYYDWGGDGIATWWNASIPRDGSGNSTDSDGDGIPDWWVNLYGIDGADGVAENDADGDGMTNYAEFVAGTDPTNPLSFFAITSVQVEVVADPETEGFALQWPSAKGRVYTVYAAEAPVGPWTALAELDGTGATLTHRSDGTQTARFFKIAVRLK